MTVILPGGLGQNMAPHVYTGFSTVNAGTGRVPPGWYSPGSITPTFSNNNRSVISAGGGLYISSTSFQTSGKRYFEVTAAAAATEQGADQTGIGNNAARFGTNLGGDAGGTTLGYNSGSGVYLVYFSGGPVYNSGIAVVNGDVVGVAVDFTVAGIAAAYLRFNASWGNGGTPSTTFPSAPDVQMTIPVGTGAIIMCSCATQGTITLNTGNAPFAHAAPAGYTSWG